MYDDIFDSETGALTHFGVKGMKWGVRRTPEQLGNYKADKRVYGQEGAKRIEDRTKRGYSRIEAQRVEKEVLRAMDRKYGKKGQARLEKAAAAGESRVASVAKETAVLAVKGTAATTAAYVGLGAMATVASKLYIRYF